MSQTKLVTYDLHDGIATITMDDGGHNLMTRPMLASLGRAFDRAADDGAVVLLSGVRQTFSAGYDLAAFGGSVDEVVATMREGGELVLQILEHPRPVVALCNGHAIAQGAFTLLACDVRIGVTADARIGLNEVAIGLTIPHYGVEVARHQLAAPWFDRATITGELLSPEQAVRAGFLHELAPVSESGDVARLHAERLRGVDESAHAGTKRRARSEAVAAIRAGIDDEFPAATAA